MDKNHKAGVEVPPLSLSLSPAPLCVCVWHINTELANSELTVRHYCKLKPPSVCVCACKPPLLPVV